MKPLVWKRADRGVYVAPNYTVSLNKGGPHRGRWTLKHAQEGVLGEEFYQKRDAQTEAEVHRSSLHKPSEAAAPAPTLTKPTGRLNPSIDEIASLRLAIETLSMQIAQLAATIERRLPRE